MVEAVRLVLDEHYSIKRAALKINAVKRSEVPRMTLSNRLARANPRDQPNVGRLLELEKEVEAALVKALKMCADFQLPMRKSDVQLLVQAYCTENGVQTRWANNKPGVD